MFLFLAEIFRCSEKFCIVADEWGDRKLNQQSISSILSSVDMMES